MMQVLDDVLHKKVTRVKVESTTNHVMKNKTSRQGSTILNHVMKIVQFYHSRVNTRVYTNSTLKKPCDGPYLLHSNAIPQHPVV